MRIHFKITLWLTSLCLILLLFNNCNETDTPTASGEEDLRGIFDLKTLSAIPYPSDNPPRQERIALGRLLFFDAVLSGEKDVSCGTCHHPDFAFSDIRQFGAGVSGMGLGPNRILSNSAVSGDPVALTSRNTPTIFNTAFNFDDSGQPGHQGIQFWDGSVNGLEAQVARQVASREAMRGDAYPGTEEEASAAALDTVIARLRNIPEYVQRFMAAFPEDTIGLGGNPASIIDSSTFVRAIASYERELVTLNSPYDRFVNGDDDALSFIQKQGLVVFFTKAKCSNCHGGPMLSDYRFVVHGVPQEGPGKELGNSLSFQGDDFGREEYTQNANDRYAFRTPTLRNVALTAPYMHDGIFNTLEEVVHFYNDGAQPRHPSVTDEMLDPDLLPLLNLTEEEVTALVEFMKALSDAGTALPAHLTSVPEIVPSGLRPLFGIKEPGSGKRQ